MDGFEIRQIAEPIPAQLTFWQSHKFERLSHLRKVTQNVLNFLQKSEDSLIPQPLLQSLGKGEPDFKVPFPIVGEGFRVRAGTFARGLMLSQ